MNLRNAYIIWWATTAHLIMGALLLYDDSLKDISPSVANTGIESGRLSGIILIAASVLATIGFRQRPENRFISWLYFLPQQFILLLTLISSNIIIATGEFNGRVIDRDTAAIILTPGMAAAVWHTVAVGKYHAAGLWRALRTWRLGC